MLTGIPIRTIGWIIRETDTDRYDNELITVTNL